jgi:hypothetical protein
VTPGLTLLLLKALGLQLQDPASKDRTTGDGAFWEVGARWFGKHISVDTYMWVVKIRGGCGYGNQL